MEIGPRFRDLFSRTTIVFLLNYLLYITYVSRYRWMQQWKPWLWRKGELRQHIAHIAAPVRKDTLEKVSCQGIIRLDFEKSRLTVLLSNKLTRRNEQDFLLVLYDKPSSKGFIISPLPEIFFSKMRPCLDHNPPPPPTKNFRLSCTVSTQDAYYIADTRGMFFTRCKSLPYLSTEDVFL